LQIEKGDIVIVRHRTNAGAIDRSFDRTFEQLTSSLFAPVRRNPEVVASWDGDVMVLTVDLPGVAPEQVSVETSGQNLTLGAETDSMQWTRTLQIGSALDLEKIEAHHLNGRLTVRIGAVDAPETRRIPVSTSPVESDRTGRVEIPAMEITEAPESDPQGEGHSSPSSSAASH
jgi:HSP20 family molecular chaperone IbpA